MATGDTIGLEKDKTLGSGVVAGFWKVINFECHVDSGMEIVVGGYTSKTAHDAGNSTVDSERIPCDDFMYKDGSSHYITDPSGIVTETTGNPYNTYFSRSALQTEGKDPLTQSYAYLKQTDRFHDATEILET